MAAQSGSQDVADLDDRDLLQSVTPADIELGLHRQLSGAGSATVLAAGIGASPGGASGRLYLTADAAVAAAQRGEDPILACRETSPADSTGLNAAVGVVTSHGGLASHAAVVARAWGKPAVVGAVELHFAENSMWAGTVEVEEGELISIDGTAGTVMLGAFPTTTARGLEQFDQVLEAADRTRRLGVLGNADTPAEVRAAIRLGAEGIGLCRTEHMFLTGQNLAVMHRLVLASDERGRDQAAAEFEVLQRDQFELLLSAVGGRRLSVRLLDPPLHEFLPPRDELRAALSRRQAMPEDLDLLMAAERLAEVNPMLGIRGVRLGVMRPEIYRAQIRALLAAASTVRIAEVEIVVPMVAGPAEVRHVRSLATEVAADLPEAPNIGVGVMIETPRAALMATQLAEVADSFSFGTNDLTQLTWGLSRDDASSRLVPAYVTAGLMGADPFRTLDEEGVGALMGHAIRAGRAQRPDLRVTVCGEHGGDPDSIRSFERLGVDAVSCSPYRVPVARLAAAQATLDATD